MKVLRWFLKEDAGQGIVEYSLIIGLVALVVVGVLTVFASRDSALFDRILSEIKSVL